MIWRVDGPEGNESAKVKYDVVQYLRGVVLDLGCGPNKVFPHAVGVDSCKDTDLFGIAMRPDLQVETCEKLDDFQDECADSVFSSHLLEHIVDTRAALAEWWKKIKVGGHLVLYLPHADLYPRIGQPGANIDHKHDFVPADILDTMQDVATGGMDIIINEVRSDGDEYSFLLVLQKRDDGLYPNTAALPKPPKTVCISRFGGFGDLLQAANLLPELKRQGYHVVFNTTPKGQDILKHDPHIDEFLIVDQDQVPNPELPLFWAALARRHDKFIQLSESIEGTLLAMPGRANHMWPHAVRHVKLNQNYLEWLSQLSEIEYQSEARFYPSRDEQDKVNQYLGAIQAARNPGLLIGENPKPVFTVLWALAGSSMHKFYPHMDAVIATIMLELPQAVVVLVGDEPCQILECGWELEPRVYRESGKLSIRDTLALAQRANCVVGPETGVLNAVAFEDNAKVIMLSHSSVENLSKHWHNTYNLTAPRDPANTICGNQPCHRLHYGKAFCVEDPLSGAAACQAAIRPEAVFAAIKQAYLQWQSRI